MERLIQALTASMDPVSLVGRVAEQACAFMPNADGAAVTLLRGSDNAYVTVSAHGLALDATGFVVAKDDSFQGQAAREKRPKLIHDALADSRLSPRVRAVNKQWGTRSWAVIPLMYHGDAIGSLLYASTSVGAFTDADLDALMAVSDFVSALVGAQLQLSALLTQVMTDSDERGQRALTARFVASVMVPEAAQIEGLQEQLDSLLAQPDALRAVFQPIVRLDDGTTAAYEGLMRFPASADVTPMQWFSAARRLGRGIDLEYAALQAILRAAAPIPSDRPVAVNLSPSAVVEPAIHDALTSQDRALIVEITEHEPFPADLGVRLKPLRDRGVSVAVDDAGAGYANFTQLLRLRPDIIKIDGEVIAGIDEDPVARAMATALKSLASELGASTVAEAVETPSQLRTLLGLGIEYGQGFHLGRPADAADHRS